MANEIVVVKRKDIDDNKWNDCIKNASNSLIYSYTFYLDTMAKHWDALVLNDYEAVMPLTYNKKYGIYYLYQPPFIASLGVFGNNITETLLTNFLNAVPAKFKYWDIYFNHGNYFSVPGYNLYQRMNYVLLLADSYENLYAGFKESTQRNIKKSKKLGCVIKKDIAINEVIKLSKEQSAKFSRNTGPDFDNIEKLYSILNNQQKAVTYGVYLNSRLVASAAFFFDDKRAYYILVGNHPDGKTIGASHALFNEFIQDNAGKKLLLDFEGSDLPKLAFFYSSFGAAEEKYPGIKLNRLPFYAKWLKK